MKKVLIWTLIIVCVLAAAFGGYWAWKYYGKPSLPDRSEYKTLQERAKVALKYARRRGMNEHYALFVDYSLPSGTSRLVAASVAAYRLWNYYFNLGISVSVSPKQNIQKLKSPMKDEVAEVVMSSDSILGVALDFYAIHGLKASIERQEPDLADTTVYLYSRCADHKPDSNYIGSLVVEGEELQSDRSRLGYMAMADNRMVIGISRSEKVKDYVLKRGGSFFRQFILVSNGEIPTRFFLYGKVERRAIGRMGDTLYYIATRHKESLWDFAYALREYGFIDAIYITGGYDYGFYRSADGERHDIGDINRYPHTKWAGVIPWLVFRKVE